MSHTEKITGELRALTSGVERAQGLAAAADRQAQEVALRAAGAGFVAVAAGVARVRNAITGIQGGLGGLAGSIGEATKATMAVPHKATPQETIAGLTPVQSAVRGTRDVAAGGRRETDGAGGHLPASPAPTTTVGGPPSTAPALDGAASTATDRETPWNRRPTGRAPAKL
ncbi:hypothetical protein [Micromonospora sp. CA-111912]|uniref:hypothetical protein n=1 Tax=Micromonospora sp. CA-111912 TaxID=3239955 RepID=UPI003D919D5F